MAETRAAVIGVTGHRHLTATPELLAAIDDVIRRLERGSRGAFVIASPLAEGADRLVPARAFALGHRRLIVPMPLPTAVYLRTFSSEASRAEFRDWLSRATEVIRLPPAESDVAAYRALGEWLVTHCDVLIAVWDGLPAQGDGGTGEVVERARATGRMPIFWIHVGERTPRVILEQTWRE